MAKLNAESPPDQAHALAQGSLAHWLSAILPTPPLSPHSFLPIPPPSRSRAGHLLPLVGGFQGDEGTDAVKPDAARRYRDAGRLRLVLTQHLMNTQPLNATKTRFRAPQAADPPQTNAASEAHPAVTKVPLPGP